MKIKKQYGTYAKPSWAPPSWLFGPVWTLLYVFITISYGYVIYAHFSNHIPWWVVLPFVLNLIFNFAFTPIQFTLRNFKLATLDIILVDITLVWALVAVFPYAAWVSYINLPYLAWTSFATILQITVTRMNT